MSSRREEERNEKIIRGLLKLPPNRRCINCNGLGPQYVCTNFWTFVCTACSGIHREFTHRVKSVSMAKFTAQEVEALQSGGNQRARELFLKNWDMQIMKLPDSSYPDKIREFIKIVYLEKKYSGRPFDKPPRDLQDLKSHEDYRRASSYHSFSQSPPYDHQYEDRRYGKQKIMLTRKPGSDHGHYEGNIPNVLYSPGRSRENVYDDRFANESASSRVSDYSLSSAGDFLRSSDQSPSTFSEPSTQRSSSLGSFWSFDSNSLHSKSANSGASVGTVFQPKHPSVSQQQPVKPTIAASEISATQHTAMIDLFSPRFSRQQNVETAVDLFVDFNNQTCAFVSHNKAAPVSSSTNEGWAVFDTVQVAPDIDTSKGLPSMTSPCLKKTDETFHSFSTTQGTSKLFLAQKLSAHGEVISTSNQWHLGFTEIQNVADSTSTPAFNEPSIFGVQHTEVMLPKVLKENGSQFPVMQDENPLIKLSSVRMPSVVPPKEVSSAQEWKSTNPFDLSYDLDAGANNMFLDMSSLHGALPNPQLPSAFLDGLSSQPWFQQNSASTYIPTVPQAGMPYAVGQVSSSQLPTCIIASQDSAPSSCNPFA